MPRGLSGRAVSKIIRYGQIWKDRCDGHYEVVRAIHRSDRSATMHRSVTMEGSERRERPFTVLGREFELLKLDAPEGMRDA